jgi:hypothetical protein
MMRLPMLAAGQWSSAPKYTEKSIMSLEPFSRAIMANVSVVSHVSSKGNQIQERTRKLLRSNAVASRTAPARIAFSSNAANPSNSP